MADKITISYSKLRDLLECPWRYALLNVQKMPQRMEIRRLLVPNIVDWILSSWIKNKFPENWLEEKGKSKFEEYCNEHKVFWKTGSDRTECLQLVIESARVLEKSMRQHNLCSQGARHQVKLKVEMGDVILSGKPDVYYEDTLDILDCKTTKEKRWLGWGQLIFYWLLASNQFGKKHGRIGFLAPQMSEPVQIREITEEDKLKCIKDIEKAVAIIRSGNYPFTEDENKHCFLCFMKHACVKGQPVALGQQLKGRFEL